MKGSEKVVLKKRVRGYMSKKHSFYPQELIRLPQSVRKKKSACLLSLHVNQVALPDARICYHNLSHTDNKETKCCMLLLHTIVIASHISHNTSTTNMPKITNVIRSVKSYIFKNSVKNIKANHQNINFLVLSLFSITLSHFMLTDYVPVLT